MFLHTIIAYLRVANRIERTARTLECNILSCIYNKYHLNPESAYYNSAATASSPVACRIMDINVNTLGGTFDFAVIPTILPPLSVFVVELL